MNSMPLQNLTLTVSTEAKDMETPWCRPELFAQRHHGKSVLPSDSGCAVPGFL